MRKCVYTFKAINITNIHSIYNDIHIHTSIQHGERSRHKKLFLIKNFTIRKRWKFPLLHINDVYIMNITFLLQTINQVQYYFQNKQKTHQYKYETLLQI